MLYLSRPRIGMRGWSNSVSYNAAGPAAPSIVSGTTIAATTTLALRQEALSEALRAAERQLAGSEDSR